jgi:hypothetical protein
VWLPKTLSAAESLMISGGVVRLKVGREKRLRPHFVSCVTDGASAHTGPKHELSLALDSSRRSARSPGLFTAAPEQQLLMEGVCRTVSEIRQISAADRIFGSHNRSADLRKMVRQRIAATVGLNGGYVMDHVRSTISNTVVLLVLGVCLVGCTSWKPDPLPPCDEADRQPLQIANLPGCAPFIQKTYNYDF